MSLREYQRKRHFPSTREPRANAKVPKGQRSLFVVQLHHASRRHFDFRLQVGNTLKSWAVPKGPSFDPHTKRLAVEVEDHPVAYADFEGDIEHGYGKGHVDQFDKGVWSTQGDAAAQLRKGHLKFELFGHRLKGGWHLVRSTRKERQPAWFLIKAKDDYAGKLEADDLMNSAMRESTRRAAKTASTRAAARKSIAHRRKVPSGKSLRGKSALVRMAANFEGAKVHKPSAAFFKPALTTLVDQPPQGDAWIHEVKWDGYRILTTIVDGEVNLWSRNALRWDEKIPDIKQAIEALGLGSARLDGELIATDAHGNSDFNALQQTLAGEARRPLAYVLFDVPYFEGYDLSRVALLERKALLEKLIGHGRPHIAFSSHTYGDGEAAMERAVAHHLEGIVSKRADTGYEAGRSGHWLKIKRLEADEFAVVGFTQPKGTRSGFGSLLLARPAPRGRSWIYAGRVGTGFSDASLREWGRELKSSASRGLPSNLSDVDPLLRDAYWVRPRWVAEVYYRGIGNNGLLRQPSLKALRTDKSSNDLRSSDGASARPSAAPKKKVKAMTDDAITITHPDRVVYPEDDLTKGDVAAYYRKVMQRLLPDVKNRPLSVIRCPEGTAKACFFQKHPIQGLKHVQTVRLKEEDGKQEPYMYVTEADAAIELVQFGSIEFHTWGTTFDHASKADRVVFDLDPAENVAWSRVVAAARLLRKTFDQLGMKSFVRTTGGKGLHVVLPLNPACTWKQVKDFAQAVAASLAEAYPDQFVATASKAKRGGKIYIDYLRNARGATSVASYSLRARPGAPVAMPLRWDDLGRVKSGQAFHIRNVPVRLARSKSDPWKGYDKVKQSLDAVLKALKRR
jgi:bifunctional non-homologous end joining protein LigD